MAPVAVGDKVQVLVGAALQWFEVVEVQTTTGAAGAFTFTTPQCSLTVQRLAGNPLANVAGDDWFAGYVLRGVDDPTLYAVGFYDAWYGERISEPVGLPIVETFTMGWQTGNVRLMIGTEPITGTEVQVVVLRQERTVTSTPARAFLLPLPCWDGTFTFKTDASGYLRWDHPDFGLVAPFFPKGVNAIGQRLGDVDWNGDAPLDYCEEVRAYYLGEYYTLTEGGGGDWQVPGGDAEITWPANRSLIVRPECWADVDSPLSWKRVGETVWWNPAGGTSRTRRFPGGIKLNVECYKQGGGAIPYDVDCSEVQSQTIIEIARGSTKTVSISAGQAVAAGITSGCVYKAPGEPLAGVGIYAWYLSGITPVWASVATTDASGYWEWDNSAITPTTLYMYVHDPTWGTFEITAQGAHVRGWNQWFLLSTVGIRAHSGFWGYSETSGGGAALTMSGAGTGACNGDYDVNGTYNGQTAYEKQGGGMWVWYDGTFWNLSSILGGGTCYYLKYSSPVLGSWDMWVSGSPPAPTASAGGPVTQTYPGYTPGKVWNLSNISYLPGSVVVERWDGATLVDTWATQDAAWGGWITSDVIPTIKYVPGLDPQNPPGAPPTQGAYYTIRPVLDGVDYWDLPLHLGQVNHLSSEGVQTIMGGTVHLDLLREKAREQIDPSLVEAIRVGVEHGELHWPMRTVWAGSGISGYSMSQLGVECPYCHRQANVEPGPLRGWSAHLDSSDLCTGNAVEVDGRTYFQSFPIAGQ